jgi:hypothetical protein
MPLEDPGASELEVGRRRPDAEDFAPAHELEVVVASALDRRPDE